MFKILQQAAFAAEVKEYFFPNLNALSAPKAARGAIIRLLCPVSARAKMQQALSDGKAGAVGRR